MSELSIVRNPPVPEEIYTVDGNSYKYYASTEVSGSGTSYPDTKTYTIGQIPISNVSQIVKASIAIHMNSGTFYFSGGGGGIDLAARDVSFSPSLKSIGIPFYSITYGNYSGSYAYTDIALSANGEISIVLRKSGSMGGFYVGGISGNMSFWLL